MTAPKTPATPWAFRARFRRAAFGWQGSGLAIERIHEALTEIRAVARQDPAAAAEGAVLLLEKLSPALNQIDSSSGSLGNANYAAVEGLVPLIGVTRLRTGQPNASPFHRGVHEISDPSLVAGPDTVMGSDGIAAGLRA